LGKKWLVAKILFSNDVVVGYWTWITRLRSDNTYHSTITTILLQNIGIFLI